jgi:SAM-dependent methyltransferase
MRHYQPYLDPAVHRLLCAEEFDAARTALLAKGGFERNCFDRLDILRNALVNDLPTSSVLDIGCANGFFSMTMKLLGAKSVIGVDNNEHVNALEIDVDDALVCAERNAVELGVDVRFCRANILELIERQSTEYRSDIVLFLSVFHHLFGGYGFLGNGVEREVLGERVAPLLSWLDKNAANVLVFETHEGIFADWSGDDIEKNLRAYTSFSKIVRAGETFGFEGKKRGLFICRRS